MSNKPTYQQRVEMMTDRATELGFGIGQRVRKNDQVGVVIGFNPFCYDDPDPSIYVNGFANKDYFIPISDLSRCD